MPVKTLVTGGIRSGKSRYAQSLLAHEPEVTYVAPGPSWLDDPEWRARVAAHQRDRPASWHTVEDQDLATVLSGLTGPALIDCLNTWLTGQLDEVGAWSGSGGQSVVAWEGALEHRITQVVDAWSCSSQRLVMVTNEVGFGLVPEHRSGRIFADWLGRLNQRVAAVSDEVVLVVAGRPLHL